MWEKFGYLHEGISSTVKLNKLPFIFFIPYLFDILFWLIFLIGIFSTSCTCFAAFKRRDFLFIIIGVVWLKTSLFFYFFLPSVTVLFVWKVGLFIFDRRSQLAHNRRAVLKGLKRLELCLRTVLTLIKRLGLCLLKMVKFSEKSQVKSVQELHIKNFRKELSQKLNAASHLLNRHIFTWNWISEMLVGT